MHLGRGWIALRSVTTSSVVAQGCDPNAEVPVEVTAGDAVVFNDYLLHSWVPNRSSIWRRAMATH
jgi:ectoine hydroxylase-related dioxygenase (phytanoyl-CoA dioxygenase family)